MSNDNLKLTWYENIKFTISDFITNWIYPAYYLKNLLINRYDLIRLKSISKYEYSDVVNRMFLANMTLITDFIDKEKPEKYVCWYKDDKGTDVGHRYGEYKEVPMLYPEYKDKYIMDIIKEIYNWYKIEYPLIENEKDYLLDFWCNYIIGEMKFSDIEDENGLLDLDFDNSKCPKTLEELEQIKDIKWDIIDKYIKDRKLIFEDNYVHNEIQKLETKIFNDKQKYLHLCIEVRPYLWT